MGKALAVGASEALKDGRLSPSEASHITDLNRFESITFCLF